MLKNRDFGHFSGFFGLKKGLVSQVLNQVLGTGTSGEQSSVENATDERAEFKGEGRRLGDTHEDEETIKGSVR